MRRIFYALLLSSSPVLLHAQAGQQDGEFTDFIQGNCNGGCATATIASGAVIKAMVMQPESMQTSGGPVVGGYATVNGQNDFFVIQFSPHGGLSQNLHDDG